MATERFSITTDRQRAPDSTAVCVSATGHCVGAARAQSVGGGSVCSDHVGAGRVPTASCRRDVAIDVRAATAAAVRRVSAISQTLRRSGDSRCQLERIRFRADARTRHQTRVSTGWCIYGVRTITTQAECLLPLHCNAVSSAQSSVRTTSLLGTLRLCAHVYAPKSTLSRPRAVTVRAERVRRASSHVRAAAAVGQSQIVCIARTRVGVQSPYGCSLRGVCCTYTHALSPSFVMWRPHLMCHKLRYKTRTHRNNLNQINNKQRG